MFSFFKKKKDEAEKKLKQFFQPAPQVRSRDVVRELASTVNTPKRKVNQATKAVFTGANNLFNPNTPQAKKNKAYWASQPTMTKRQAKSNLSSMMKSTGGVNRQQNYGYMPIVQVAKQRSLKPLFDKKNIAQNLRANVSDPYNAMGGGMSKILSKSTGRLVNKAMQKGVSPKGLEQLMKFKQKVPRITKNQRLLKQKLLENKTAQVAKKLDPTDKQLMTDFIDQVRLGKKENVKLEISARQMAEAMGIDPNVPNRKLVQKFEDIFNADSLRKKNFAKTVQKENMAGAVAGFQQDEEGNIKYDPKAGLMGVAGLGIARNKKVRGAMKKAPQKIDDFIKSKPVQKVRQSQQQLSEITSPNQKKSLAQGSPVPTSLDNVVNDSVRKGQPYNKVNNTQRITQKQRMSTEALVKKQGANIGDDGIRQFREQQLLGKETIDEIVLRKRGVITDKDAVESAKKLQFTIDDVANAPKGKTYNKEELTAISQVVQKQREDVQSLKQLLEGGGKSQSNQERKLIAELGDSFTNLKEDELVTKAIEESVLKLKKAEYALMAAKSEAGRALQGSKQSIDAIDSRMRVVYGHLKKKSPLERQAILERIAKEPMEDEKNFIKLLDDINTSDGFDKFAEWATATKLYNPTTHIVNFGSNTLRQLTDMAITGVTNPKTAIADMHGAKVGLGQGLKNALRALTDEGYARTLSKYIEEGGQSPAIKGTKGQVIRSSFRALGAGDEIFRGMAYQRSLYRQAHRQAKGNTKKMEKLLSRPTFKMMDEAKSQADRMTFQEEMGEITKKFNNWRTPANYKSKVGKSVGLTARLFVPFLKTPTNLFKQAADFSPISLIKNKDALITGFKKGASQAEQEQAKRLMGEAVVGTAFIAYVSSLIGDGRITGKAPSSEKERNQFYAEGKIPYAIKFGDKWVQYNRIDPLSTVIGLTADIANSPEKDASELFNIVADNLSDKTYTKGMGDFLKLIGGDAWEREGILQSQFVSSFVPGISGAVARSVDPVVRETKGEKKVLGIPFSKGLKEKITAQIPFASKTLPAKRNVVGEEIDRQKDIQSPVGKFTNQLFNPIKTSNKSDNPVIQEIGNLDHALSTLKDSFTTNGKEYKMTPEEYEMYSADIGQRINEEVGAFIQSGEYQNLSDEEKVEKIDNMRDDIMADVKADFVRNNAEKVGDPYYELKKSLDNADEEGRQAILDSMPVSEKKKFKTYLNKEEKAVAKGKSNIAQDYRHSKVQTRQTKLFNEKMNKLKEMDEWKNASGDDREKIVKEFSTKSKHHAVAQMIQENSQGMNDEELKKYLGELKKAGILNKTIFEVYVNSYQ